MGCVNTQLPLFAPPLSAKALIPTGGTGEERPADDYWRSPGWFVRSILRAVDPVSSANGSVPRVLDAGAGVIARLIEEHFAPLNGGKLRSCAITTVETDIRRAATYPTHWESVVEDFFAWSERQASAPKKRRRYWDYIATNPPFRIGDEHVWAAWVQHCFLLLAPYGELVVAGHANLLRAKKRLAFWNQHPPFCWWISPRAVDFTAKKGSNGDGRVWGWFHFRHPGSWTTRVQLNGSPYRLLDAWGKA